MFAFNALLLSLFHIIFRTLVSDSNINFETYKVLKLSFYSIAGFVSVILLLLVPVFFILKTCIYHRNTGFSLATHIPGILLIVFTAILSVDTLSLPVVLFFYIGVVALFYISIKRKTSFFNISVIFSILFGLYSLFVMIVFSEKKTNENLRVQALSLSTDHDPVAEHLILDLWPEVKNDPVLKGMMDVEYFGKNDHDSIFNYLRERYFSGYWGNFSFNIFLCRSDQSIQIGKSESSEVEDCFSFFDERVQKYGHPLTGTDFYFIDNQGARSNYLGRLFFPGSSGYVNGIFMELYSDINVFQPGYSELLLDKKFRGYSGLKDYSFAKYINGEIVLKSGDYAYNKNDEGYIDRNSEYRLFNEEGFTHTLYWNGNATIIISRPEIGAGNLIISFAYLFIFIFVFSNLFIMIIRPPVMKSVVSLNFRQKLQASFTGILLGSFILTGVIAAYLTIRQYKTEYNSNIREKLNSVYLELENKIGNEKYLSSDWQSVPYSSLNELLINLSNIFNTDINLYDMSGFLLATSRPEIFYRDLAAPRMDNLAYINLRDLRKSEYIQNEELGNMSYISAYVPFYNNDNKVIAYMNLPYFRMQSLLTRQISNLIVTVINFTLILILLAMSFAVFISGRLTSPLLMLSRGLASVELGKKSMRLEYHANDEIGEMVRQYNNMVDELDESARKLTNSEREYAWREMAKQIAHEIKNPLTPMKLNVQQLIKSWKDGVPGFEKKLEGFTKNQIEYIDNLSSIASAFSSFAKMPGTNPSVINLLEQLRLTLELFRNTDNISFRVKWPRESKVFIYADKEHLNGIFSNLIKNSIQSIPSDREGIIKVSMEVFGDKVTISVTDNGTGIPESLQARLFTPNFTTKSSGMGLGLSIVRKYVEGANGRIWFESEADKGTTFHVEFPLMYTVEKPGESADA
jgi:signal transduction histidine kinase